LLVEPVVRLKRGWSNAVIAVALGAFVLGVPPLGAVHGEGRERLRAILARLHVKPPEWRLFAPNVHKTNAALSAEVTLADGSVRHWSSPELAGRPLHRRFREGQLPKFYDNVRRDRHRAAWRPFAAWVAREAGRGERVTHVRLVRTVVELPPPGREEARVVRHAFYERWFR
jgi:hypothetical protein